MIKDTDEQAGEGIHKVRSGRVLATSASVLMELGHTTLQPRNSPYPVIWGFL